MIDGEVEAIELRSAWVNGQSDLQTRLDNARRLHLKLQAQSAEHLERGELAAFDAVAEVAHAIGAVIREIDEASSFKSRSSLVSVGTSDTMSSLGGSRLDAFDPFQTQVPPSDPLTLSVFVSHAHWIPLGPTQTAYVTLNLKSAGGFGAAACSTEARLTPQGEASWFETLSVPAPVGCTLEQATQLVVQLVDASVTAKPLAYGVVELAADAALPSSLLLKTAVKHSTNVFELQPHEDPPVLYFNLGGDRWMHFPAVAYSTPPKAAELDVPAGLDLASHEAHSIATKAAEPMAVTRWDLASRVASSLTTPLPLGRPRPAALAPLAAVNQQQKEENAHLRAVIRRLTSEVSQWRGRFDQTSSLLCVAKEATGRLKAEATRASEAAEGLKKIESVVKDLKQSNAALSEDAMSLTSKLTDTEFALQEQRARYLNEVKVRKHLEKSLRQAEDKINAQRHKLHLCDAEIDSLDHLVRVVRQQQTVPVESTVARPLKLEGLPMIVEKLPRKDKERLADVLKDLWRSSPITANKGLPHIIRRAILEGQGNIYEDDHVTLAVQRMNMSQFTLAARGMCVQSCHVAPSTAEGGTRIEPRPCSPSSWLCTVSKGRHEFQTPPDITVLITMSDMSSRTVSAPVPWSWLLFCEPLRDDLREEFERLPNQAAIIIADPSALQDRLIPGHIARQDVGPWAFLGTSHLSDVAVAMVVRDTKSRQTLLTVRSTDRNLRTVVLFFLLQILSQPPPLKATAKPTVSPM